jgi:anti-sigma factor RsiW
MTRCEQYEPYLAALADDQADTLPPEVRRELLEHVAACSACRDDIARQRQLARLLVRSSPPAVHADRWQQVWDAIDRQTTNRPRRLVYSRWHRWAAGAVAAAAIILVAVLFWPFGGQPAQQFAFATGQDSDIQVLETDAQDETPVVITSGQQDVVVVWVVHDSGEETHT